MKVCNARLQYRPWRRCRQRPCKGKKRCKFHGGRLRGPRPRYDEDGNYIVPNLEARNAGYRRWVERRRMITEAIVFAALKEGMKPSQIARAHRFHQTYVCRVAKRVTERLQQP